MLTQLHLNFTSDLQSQLSDRKSAEKLARKLENELSEVHASKSRLDAHYRNSLQVVWSTYAECSC